jgi:hypothetical protein
MGAIPDTMRHLPVYITETGQDVAWLDQNIAWVQAAYGEINYWNLQPGYQQIRALVLYRWPQFDKWYIKGKEGVIADFRQALPQGYAWSSHTPPAADYDVGDWLATRDLVNFRRTPGYLGQPPDDVITTLPEGSRVRVVTSAYVEADGLVWWSVVSEEGDEQGWLAQFDGRDVPLVRLVSNEMPAGPDGVLEVGSLATTLTTVRLRRSPGYVGKPADDTIMAVAADTEVAIAGGPILQDGLTWWEVRGIDGTGELFDGWMAERDPSGVRLLQETGELQRPDISLLTNHLPLATRS